MNTDTESLNQMMISYNTIFITGKEALFNVFQRAGDGA
jgi:hypothetical protein